jgi:predicted nucleic acid-binding protein
MIVVSDTSPITALLTVGHAGLLPNLFGEVIIPPAVKKELQRTHSVLPDWLHVQSLQSDARASIYARSVDRGEAEAIALAQELHANHLLIDERKGRRLAQEQGLQVLGLLGVVLLARRMKLIPSARVLLTRLDQEAGIYLADDLKNAALKSVGE